jgi:hypothetical protein
VPKGLGGSLIFLGASCESCRVITSRFEEDCLGKDYKHFRADAAMPMNRKVHVTNDYSVVLPVLPRAGILVGRPPTTELLLNTVQRTWFKPNTVAPKQPSTPAPEQDNTFRYRSFIRMLAKMGYGYALGGLGSGNFLPLVPDLILWRNPTLLQYLVGCADQKVDAEMRRKMPITKKDTSDPTSPRTQQQLRLYAISPDGKRALAVVLLRLFAYFEHTLTYEIVVGELAADHPLCAPLRRPPPHPSA